MSRDTRDLHPTVRDLAQKLLVRASDNGTPILITFTKRSIEEQEALYAQGRKPLAEVNLKRKSVGLTPITEQENKRIVTKARGGQSYHNYGLAFDVALIVGKRVVWESEDVNQNSVDDWEEVGKLGEELGLEWAGRWEKFKERAHFQYTFGLSINDLLNGKRPNV